MSQPDRVGKPAHAQGSKNPQANCCFVRTESAVSLRDMSKILNNILIHAGGEQLFRSRYAGFKAFVQRAEDRGPADFNPFDNHLFPGETVRVSLQTCLDSVCAKIKDLQKPKGQVSASPPPFLQDNSLVIVVGTEEFLIAHAYIYLETYGLYREQLFKLIFDCLSLSRWTPGIQIDDEHSTWHDLSNNKHFKANVNFLAAIARESFARVLSTEELMADLASRDADQDDEEEEVES